MISLSEHTETAKGNKSLTLICFITETMPYPAIFWDAGFSTSVARRKTVVRLRSLGDAVNSPKTSPRVKPKKILAILHFKSSKHCSCGSAHYGTSA